MISCQNFRAIGFALLTFAAPAAAETVVSMDVYRAVDEVRVLEGEPVTVEVLQPAHSAIPGDKLTYQIEVENQGQTASSDISLNLPVSSHVTFLEGSVQSTIEVQETFSVDQGTHFAQLDDLFVGENEERRPATPSDITHLRMVIPELASGETATVSYSITLN